MPGSQFQTDCGILIKAVYGPGDIADLDERRDLGDPGLTISQLVWFRRHFPLTA